MSQYQKNEVNSWSGKHYAMVHVAQLESEYLSVLTLWQLAFEISNFTQIMGLGE
jgi:hypothetical protein